MANSNELKKYHFLYKTTNLLNGNFYIGIHSTNNLNDGYLGSGKRLIRSIKKHGKETFKLEILQYFECRELLVEKEKELVNEELIKDHKCLNLKPGGDGGFVNEEHRKKFLMSAKKTMLKSLENGRKTQKHLRETDENWVNKMKKIQSKNAKGNKSFTNRTHKEESKIKIGLSNSIKQKGDNNSQFGTCWITNGIDNKKIKKNTPIPKGWDLGRKLT
jgi:hypothetical protein